MYRRLQVLLIVVLVLLETTKAVSTLSPTAHKCVDRVDAFREATRLADINCADAFESLHENCITKIPTAPQYQLWDFCCAFCYQQTNPTPTTKPTEVVVATDAPTSELTTVVPEIKTTSGSGSDGDSDVSTTSGEEGVYTTSDAVTTGGISSNTNNAREDESEDYESPVFIFVTVVVVIYFVAGWIIMWFELEKKGWWERQTTERPTKFTEMEETEVDSELGDEEYEEKRGPHERHQSSYSNLASRFPTPHQHQRFASSPFPAVSNMHHPAPYNGYGHPMALPYHHTPAGHYPHGPHGHPPHMAPASGMMLQGGYPMYPPPPQGRRNPDRDAPSYNNQRHYKHEEDTTTDEEHGDQTESSARHHDENNNSNGVVYAQL